MSSTVTYRYYVHFEDGGEEGCAYFESCRKAIEHMKALSARNVRASLWEEEKTIVTSRIAEVDKLYE